MKPWIIWIQIMFTPVLIAVSVMYYHAVTTSWREQDYGVALFMASITPFIAALWVLIWYGLPRILS